MSTVESGERIAKVIARAGLCSRRDAERLIAEGRVRVDGAVLDSPALNVAPDARITVDGTPLPKAEAARLWRYHKPKGILTTARDPQGRVTVHDRLPPGMPRVVTVGRLDMSSEGLLLLTNDGGLKRKLELPATGWTRRYRVRVHGRVDPARLKALQSGVRVSGIDYGPIQARLERQSGANAWLIVSLAEGKNRAVRRVLEHVGLTVNRLIRVAYGPFQLGRLPRGKVAAVPAKVLREQLGVGERAGGTAAGAEAKPRAPGAGWAKARPKRKKTTTRKSPRHAHRRRKA